MIFFFLKKPKIKTNVLTNQKNSNTIYKQVKKSQLVRLILANKEVINYEKKQWRNNTKRTRINKKYK